MTPIRRSDHFHLVPPTHGTGVRFVDIPPETDNYMRHGASKMKDAFDQNGDDLYEGETLLKTATSSFSAEQITHGRIGPASPAACSSSLWTENTKPGSTIGRQTHRSLSTRRRASCGDRSRSAERAGAGGDHDAARSPSQTSRTDDNPLDMQKIGKYAVLSNTKLPSSYRLAVREAPATGAGRQSGYPQAILIFLALALAVANKGRFVKKSNEDAQRVCSGLRKIRQGGEHHESIH
jgi:hypothetical protein